MKVSYVTTQFPSPSETFASNDVRALNGLGVDISVYAMKPAHKHAHAMISERDLAGIPINSCGITENLIGISLFLRHPIFAINAISWIIKNEFGKPRRLFKCFLLLPASFAILYRIEKQKPDVVHLFWGHYPSLVGYMLKRRFPGIKLSIFLGAYDLEMGLGISRSLAGLADYIFTHAKANLPQLANMKIDTEAVNVVYRGLDIDYLNKICYGQVKDSGTWCTAGRLLHSKGFDRVLRLFEIAYRNNPKLKLSILGDGPARADLVKLASDLGCADAVSFMGHIPHSEVVKNMCKSDIFLLFSEKPGERLPNVVKEAMYSECVCFVTASQGINELIQHGKTGFVVSQDDLNSLYRFIASLDRKEMDAIGKRAKRYIESQLDSGVSMQKYIDAWNNTRISS